MLSNNIIIQILREKLKIPISEIKIEGKRIIIFSSSVKIGTISYDDFSIYKDSVFPKTIVNWFKWNTIYHNNKNKVDKKIKLEIDKIYPNKKTKITLSTFRILHLLEIDSNNVEFFLASIKCSFSEKRGWDIYINTEISL